MFFDRLLVVFLKIVYFSVIASLWIGPADLMTPLPSIFHQSFISDAMSLGGHIYVKQAVALFIGFQHM